MNRLTLDTKLTSLKKQNDFCDLKWEIQPKVYYGENIQNIYGFNICVSIGYNYENYTLTYGNGFEIIVKKRKNQFFDKLRTEIVSTLRNRNTVSI